MAEPIVAFLASLASRGDCLKIDAEGEATLTLSIPATDAPRILGAYGGLQDRTFHVVIVDETQNTEESTE